MAELLLIIIVTSLFCFGWNYVTNCPYRISRSIDEPNKITGFGKPDNPEAAWWFRYYVGNFIYWAFPNSAPTICKPLFGCVICMSSVYGSILYWCWFGHNGINYVTITSWLVVVIASAGLTRILKQISQT